MGGGRGGAASSFREAYRGRWGASPAHRGRLRLSFLVRSLFASSLRSANLCKYRNIPQILVPACGAMSMVLSMLFTLMMWVGAVGQLTGDTCSGDLAEEFSILQTKASIADIHKLETIEKKEVAIRCALEGQTPGYENGPSKCCPGLQMCTKQLGRAGWFGGCYPPGHRTPIEKDAFCEPVEPAYPNDYLKQTKDCQKTGATCTLGHCFSFRSATCVNGECVCQKGCAKPDALGFGFSVCDP
jgi:hypothetical protein